MTTRIDRSRDLSQPLERLSPDESLKAGSDALRGTIAAALRDPITAGVPPSDAKLLKFHGIYQQDDRDLRAERRKQKLEPAHQFMVRVRLPGGVASAEQWRAIDGIGREYGDGTLRLTTRQTFQFHGVLRGALAPAIARLDRVLLDTIAACGDDCRGVVCSVAPELSRLHRDVHALARRASAHLLPRTRAYREIWLGDERVAGGEGAEEPFYGRSYLPRKFKIGFALPPSNDVDIYTQDLGFIAIAEGERLMGFDVCVGGGMGRTARVPETYPRLADVIGFVEPDRVLQVAEHTVAIQREYGDRKDRSRARFKYTLDDKGLPWFRAELEARLGFALAPPRPYRFERNADLYGWRQGSDGLYYLTLFVENGRVANRGAYRLMDGLRAIAERCPVEFRLTPNQNLVIARVDPPRRSQVEALLGEHGVDAVTAHSPLRLHSLACVALPTCGLAMAESERYLPQLIGKLEGLLRAHGLTGQPIVIRMTGCPNGCARPYVAEIALTGRAPGKYDLYLGGGAHGERLNRLRLENAGEAEILAVLDDALGRYARERADGEPFGDFVERVDYAPPRATPQGGPR